MPEPLGYWTRNKEGDVKEHIINTDEVEELKERIIRKMDILRKNQIHPKVVLLTEEQYYSLRIHFSENQQIYGLGITPEAYFERMGIKLLIHHDFIKKMGVY